MNSIKETLAKIVFLLVACVSILAVALICIFLFANGIPAMAEIGLGDFLLGTTWRPSNGLYGIFPMILGSVYVTAGAVLLGVPVGIMTAMYMAFFASKRTLRVLQPAVELLAGIPSVVYGFFGLIIFVPMINTLTNGAGGDSLLAAIIVLAVMILPSIISVSETALNAVSQSYYEGSLALGATHERSVFAIMLPAAKSGVLAGVILGIGRAIGETMAVIMVAGNQPRILKGVRTLTANIVIEMGYAADLHREALIATAVVLFTFILIINVSFSLLKRRKQV